MVQTVKNLPTMQETLVQSLGQEDPLEEGVVTHSSILAWRIPWTEEPGRLQSPSPGDLPNPGIKPMSPSLQADSLPAELPGKPIIVFNRYFLKIKINFIA